MLDARSVRVFWWGYPPLDFIDTVLKHGIGKVCVGVAVVGRSGGYCCEISGFEALEGGKGSARVLVDSEVLDPLLHHFYLLGKFFIAAGVDLGRTEVVFLLSGASDPSLEEARGVEFALHVHLHVALGRGRATLSALFFGFLHLNYTIVRSMEDAPP